MDVTNNQSSGHIYLVLEMTAREYATHLNSFLFLVFKIHIYELEEIQ